MTGGQVLTDLAVAIADGATVICDIETLVHQGELYGPVASASTAWRALEEVGADADGRVARARAQTRARVWKMIEDRHGRFPPARTGHGDLGDTVVIRLDATIQVAHSDKEQAAGTFKGTYGHHPLTAWCDNTEESLAIKLRPGNAGSNTAADHVEVLDAAIAQIPPERRRDLLITCDGAGSTHALVGHIAELNAAQGRRVHYSVGFDLDQRGRDAITMVPERVWEHVLDADGRPRDLEAAGAAELTGLMRHSVGGDTLANWDPDMRIICRREKASSGAQLSLFEHDNALALPTHRHQHPRRRAATARSPPPPPRPGRGPNPHRQGHRPAPPALATVHRQPSMVPHRGHRHRPTRLAAPARPRRRPGPSRAENPAPPPPAHLRPTGQRRTPPANPHPRNLAMGQPTRQRHQHPARHAHAHLTPRPRPNDPKGPNPGSGTGRPPTRPPANPRTSHTRNTRSNRGGTDPRQTTPTK